MSQGAEETLAADVGVQGLATVIDGPPRSRGVGLGGIGGAIPITFGPVHAPCAGWFHPSQRRGRSVGVVLCKPIGFEGSCAHESISFLAGALAEAGFPVIRFDYYGTGDSPGVDTDPDRVTAWLESVKHAVAEVKRRAAVHAVSLVGIRLGATLAARAAADLGGVASLVLWAPCASGRSFARELRVSSVSASPVEASDTKADADIEAFGFVYTQATLRELKELDLSRLDAPPAPRALIVGRDDMPGEGPLHGWLRKSGADVCHLDLPGFVSMMREPREEDVDPETFDAITAWLDSVHPPASSPLPAQPVGPMSVRTSLTFDGVKETPLVFGPLHNLYGVMTEPESNIDGDPRCRVAALLLNVGTNYHIGPNRMYVTMARELASHGYRSLRFDLAAIGDSRRVNQSPEQRIFDKSSTADVKSAMDAMSRHGCDRFVLIGVCSGAYTAFQTAIADERVTGQVLMNPRRLTWKTGDTLQSAMSRSYKSTIFYRRAIMELGTYARILRGEVDVRGISNRLLLLAQARAGRIGSRLLGRTPDEEDVLLNLKRLCARGTDALVMVAPEDDCLDYLEFHLGTRGRAMEAHRNFRMMVVDGSDHTFSHPESLKTAMNAVLELLDRRYTTVSRRFAP